MLTQEECELQFTTPASSGIQAAADKNLKKPKVSTTAQLCHSNRSPPAFVTTALLISVQKSGSGLTTVRLHNMVIPSFIRSIPQGKPPMQRWSSSLLLLAVLIAGCQVQDSDTSSSEPSTAPAESGNSRRSVAFVTNQIADFWKIAEAGCVAASKEFDIDVQVIMPPEASAVVQQQKVEDLMSTGIQAIAISPLDADNQKDWLNSVAQQVPLITHDSDAPDADRLLYIGMDNYAAGRKCGEILRDAVPDGGQILLTIGRLEQDNSKFRRQGVIDVLLDRDRTIDYYRSQPEAFDPEEELTGNGYTIVATLTDQGKPEVALQKAEDALVAWPDLKGIAGLFEYNPPAIYQALSKAGKIGKVAIAGFDENDVTLQAIKDGECAGTVVQNPYMYGYESVRVLNDLLQGKEGVIPDSKYVDIPPRAITADNVDSFWEELKRLKGQ